MMMILVHMSLAFGLRVKAPNISWPLFPSVPHNCPLQSLTKPTLSKWMSVESQIWESSGVPGPQSSTNSDTVSCPQKASGNSSLGNHKDDGASFSKAKTVQISGCLPEQQASTDCNCPMARLASHHADTVMVLSHSLLLYKEESPSLWAGRPVWQLLWCTDFFFFCSIV